ncbi:MAG: alpha/beta hydrolase, partial [Sandaracinaceae bacterium]|nr:alpha/beta hydrolase [Sandaracinaceae bacterium]
MRRIVGEGRTVLFVHAALSDGSTWDDVLARTPEGVRAVVLDLPEVAYDAPGTTLGSLEESFCAHVGDLAGINSVTLVGHSFGAWVVARALSTLGSRARRAILVGGVASLPPEMSQAYEDLAARLATGAIIREQALGVAVDNALGSTATPELRRRLVKITERCPLDRLVRSLRLVASLGAPEAVVPPFDTPATVIHSEGDRSAPLALGKELAALGRAA